LLPFQFSNFGCLWISRQDVIRAGVCGSCIPMGVSTIHPWRGWTFSLRRFGNGDMSKNSFVDVVLKANQHRRRAVLIDLEIVNRFESDLSCSGTTSSAFLHDGHADAITDATDIDDDKAITADRPIYRKREIMMNIK